MLVLDTNVVSEILKPRPAPEVIQWFEKVEAEKVCFTAIGEAELLYGTARLPAGQRRTSLEAAISRTTEEFFAERVLCFNRGCAPIYAHLRAESARRGVVMTPSDAMIAAIAALHNATLATRNTKDFELAGVPLVNPWNPL